jgi:uncharacterized coiled-coil protein SlyX
MDQRIIALEEKVAYLEKYTSDLNDVLLDLGKQVEALKREIAGVEGRIDDLLEAEDPAAEDGPPPHY